jgi:glycerol-3-phosphate dehydrogenase (NAD(P)+)
MCDGMGLGANTKAFVGTVALREMTVICESLGGRRDTVFGLAGVGDLLTTGWSQHSRNRTFGEKLGADADWRSFMEEKTVEGVTACRAIGPLIPESGDLEPEQQIGFSLFWIVNRVLADNYPAREAMQAFFRNFHFQP